MDLFSNKKSRERNRMKNMKLLLMALGLGMMAVMTGCASIPQSTPADQIPASSPLSKVKIGMSAAEVQHIAGKPTSELQKFNWVNYVPIYGAMAKNTSQMVNYYKGQGVVTLGKGVGTGSLYNVIAITYNPNTSGYEGSYSSEQNKDMEKALTNY